MNEQIRKAIHSDLQAISELVLAAFGVEEGPEIVQLIADLLADRTASPTLSLVAEVDGELVGHILFSKAHVESSDREVSAALLAPLAVHPDQQARGIGGRLIREGLAQLAAAGVDLIFVLGHPGYYPRFGFSEAGIRGFAAPYPIAPRNAGAWMVQALRPEIIGMVSGRVACAEALADPKYWHE